MKINKPLSLKIENISFFLIIMVIYIHSFNVNLLNKYSINTGFFKQFNYFFQCIISQGVSRSAVPIFFVISGILFFKNYTSLEDYYGKLKNRLRSIILPLVIWNCVVMLIYYMIQLVPEMQSLFNSKLIANYRNLDFLYYIFIRPIDFPLWFLRDLFTLVLFAPLIYWVINKYHKFILLILLILWMLNVGAGAKLFIFKSEPALFFAIGAYIAIKNNSLLEIGVRPIIMLLLSISYLLLLMTNFYLKDHLQLESWPITVVNKTMIFFGVVFFWYVFDYNFLNNRAITAYTFLFYVFHEPWLNMVKKSAYFIFGNNVYTSFSIYLFAPVLVVSALFIVGRFWRCHAPGSMSFMLGGR